MTTGSKGLGLAVLALLAGFGGGCLAALLVTGGEATAAQAAAAPAGEPALGPQLRALAEELAALRAQLQRAAPALAPDDAAPRPLQPAPRDDAALLAALERLVAAVSGGGAGSGLVVPPPDAQRHARATALLDLRDDDLVSSHRLWPAQRVLDEYGVPDEIYVGDSTEKWVWRERADEAVALVLFRGHVVEVQRW